MNAARPGRCATAFSLAAIWRDLRGLLAMAAHAREIGQHRQGERMEIHMAIATALKSSAPKPTVRPRQGVSMSALIHPKTITVDGLSVRYAAGGQDGPAAILMSPWPESETALEGAWPHLAGAAHLVAIDPPGFGGSDYRQTLMNPKAMGHFILNVADALGLNNPHIVGPDIGTSSVLFAAAADQDRFRSIVVGSGGAAVPLDVTGVLKEWIEAPDLEPYRQIGGRKIVEIALGTIAGYTPSDEIREDYMSCYEGDRFADTIPYAQSYREYLPELAK